MTLEENIRTTLVLIEEYAPKNEMLTDDEDIAMRMKLLYSTSYQELAQAKKIVKTKEYQTTSQEEGYTEYSLPMDYYQLKSIIAQDENNQLLGVDYYTVGKKIYLKNVEGIKYKLEYYAYPTVISENTPNSFALEIDQDVQMILPYMVASDILKVDPSADYTAFERAYQRKLQTLDTRKKTPSATVKSMYNLNL